MHSKYYLILKDFHKKLCKLQQLEDELKNNVQKWHWAGHVAKDNNEFQIGLMLSSIYTLVLGKLCHAKQ
jgi:hypothetical protein